MEAFDNPLDGWHPDSPEQQPADPFPNNIKTLGINEQLLSPEDKILLWDIQDFTQQTSTIFQEHFRDLMSSYQQYNPNFTDAIIKKMTDRGYDLPRFSIYGYEAGRQFLQNIPNLEIPSIIPHSFLVNFNLPKPIARFWYHGGSGFGSIDIQPDNIAWGEFYREVMPVIWQAVDNARYTNQPYLYRLNPFGQHDHQAYYYLWLALSEDIAQQYRESDLEWQSKEQAERDQEYKTLDQIEDMWEDRQRAETAYRYGIQVITQQLVDEFANTPPLL